MGCFENWGIGSEKIDLKGQPPDAQTHNNQIEKLLPFCYHNVHKHQKKRDNQMQINSGYPLFLLWFFVSCYLILFLVFTNNQIHTVEVTGSIPVPPTNDIKGLWQLYAVNPFLLGVFGDKT